MDRSQFLLRTYQQMIQFVEEIRKIPEDYDYLNSVYGLLLKLAPGETLVYDKIVKTYNLPKFLKCVSLFCWEYPDFNIEFSEDFLTIKRK